MRGTRRTALRHGIPVLAAGLYGIRPLDPLAFALVTGGMILVAFIASYLPAVRATAVNPVETLRGG
jgi:ABC-type lipoprotein release transport system permease subunit